MKSIRSFTKTFLISLIILYTVEKLYVGLTGDFRLSNVRYEETTFKPRTAQIHVDEKKLKNIKKILDQPYKFLDQGNQSYAFESEDGNYVLKFFKFGHLKQHLFSKFLPSIPFLTPYLKRQYKSQEKRFVKVFNGYQIAYQEDPENAALLFVHLYPTTYLNQKVIVKDILGFSHTIDLDPIVFVIQEKVTPTKEILSKLLDEGDLQGVYSRIDQLFTLYLTQYQKGIYDRDHNLIYNTGFKDSKAIRLDVGKLRKNEEAKNPQFFEKDLEKIAFQRIHRFVKKYYPHYQHEVKETLKVKLNESINQKKDS